MTEFETLKERIHNFDYHRFSWKEATSDADGKSSVGLVLCFWYGLVLTFGTALCFTLFILKNTGAIVTESSVNMALLFIGTQFPLVLKYLFDRKVNEEKPASPTIVSKKELNIKSTETSEPQ